MICDPHLSGAPHVDRVRRLYQTLQMRVVTLSAADHDRHAAFVSHLSHISSFVLASTVLEEEKNTDAVFDLAGGGFESTVRLAKSSPETWAPILEQNHDNVADALDAYIGQLQAFRRTLAARDPGQTRARLADANRIRRVLSTIHARKDSTDG